MPASAYDSFYFRDRYGSPAMRAIWDDRAMVQRWLDVEGALALTEAELGLVPASAAREIARRARVDLIDLAAMKREFDTTWNPVMPLVDALRKVVRPSAARWIHWGATSKNIIDTALALQIKATYGVVERELEAVAAQLARLARRHRDTVMAGRTHGQHALPVTFGYKAAVWLDEVLRQGERLEESKPRVLVGEFGGAVGTMASLGRTGLAVQDRLMDRLGLGVPRIAAKTAGDRFAEFFLLLALISATLGKIGQNVYNLQVTDVDEAVEFTEGKVGSSAMPHKLNPVASGSVVLLGRLLRARATTILDYVHSEWEDDHRQGETAWAFPQEVCLLLGAQLVICRRLLATLVVKPENMLRNLDRSGGVVLSEPVMMALAPKIGRDAAHALTLAISRDALQRQVPFKEAVAAHPDVRRHLTARQIAAALDYRRALGLAGTFVDRVLAVYSKNSPSRRPGRRAAAGTRSSRGRPGPPSGSPPRPRSPRGSRPRR
jgi:3-carboxy-cis,cis-muconate cycloisomerase